MNADCPVCHVIAGPNGAGKTTFAMRYLPRVAQCAEFVNADAIAKGLSPFNESAVQVQAGRIFLERINSLLTRCVSFALETTLSGRGHLALLDACIRAGYRIELNYLWIPSATFSAQRVASRVASGGHDIPAEAIARRYAKSLANLVTLYMGRCHYVGVWDNAAEVPRLIYERDIDGETIVDGTIWSRILEYRI